jgi:hypothetical protein
MPSSVEALAPDLRVPVEALLGRPLVAAVKVGGGANSRVYRVSDSHMSYALKLYPSDPARDRLGAEATALEFLRRHGLDTVPRVIAADRARRIGLFEWIEGGPVGAPGDGDIAAACDLLGALHRLRGAEPAITFPSAAEACLSAAELVGQVERRRARLDREAAQHPALASLLAEGVAPALGAARGRAEACLSAAEIDAAAELAPERRSLSPSDFGFHNAIRRGDGRLAFCDFEYFGWDDPVKPVADFLLHPGMTMTETQRRTFAAVARAVYGADGTYALRLRALFPLYGLRWCLILLNEFLPERWARRVEAGAASDRESVLEQQLAKARRLLEIAQASMGEFPYGE